MTQQAQAPTPNAAPIITIEQADQHSGETVTIRGWLYNLRESGKLLFPIFRDGTGIIQGVVSLKEQPQAFEALKGLPQESSVIVTGKIQAEPRAPGGYEIHISGIEVVQRVSDSEPYPIQLKEHGVDFLLDKRHLWIRTPRQAAILRIPRRSRTHSAQLHGFTGLHAHRRARLYSRRMRRHHHALRSELYRRPKSLSDAIWPALCRSHRRRTRQGIYIRSHVPRRKIKKRAATSPNSGCSSPKPPTRTLKTWSNSAKASSAQLCSP